jgi:hypothetical protein
VIVILRAALVAALSVGLLPSASHGQRRTIESLQRQVDSLERRAAGLERRIDVLEALVKAGPLRTQANAGAPNARDLANWRRFRHGMTMDDVRALLGEPDNVNAGARLTLWSYPDYGSVTFVDGRVSGWVEPRK